MTDNRYTIISGFHHGRNVEDIRRAHWFYRLWASRVPTEAWETIVIANGGSYPPKTEFDDQVINLEGDCGHVHQLLGKQEPAKPHAYCGWSSVVLAGAMLCYANETDAVFVEQDCLMFGDCIGKMYEELGTGGMIFGKSKVMPCAQSLFLIRHKFIPEFVFDYLNFADDREMLPEQKFAEMLAPYGKRKQFSFGYDRDRPINYDDPVFYFQKATPDELRECERRGLLTLPPNMPEVRAFTGDLTGI